MNSDNSDRSERIHQAVALSVVGELDTGTNAFLITSKPGQNVVPRGDLLSLFCIVFAVFVTPPLGGAVLSIGSMPGYPGTTVSVPLTLRQPGQSAVAAQFDVAFNPGKVSALEPMRGQQLTSH